MVERTLNSDHDISVVVDIDWRGYYVGRKDHPISEAENVIFNSNNEVEKIGKINTGNEEVHGEFIGMIKLSNRGTEIFKEHFHRLKKYIGISLFKELKFSKSLPYRFYSRISRYWYQSSLCDHRKWLERNRYC